MTANASDLSTGNHNVTAAEYFIDSAGADGTGTTMAATDATFDSPSENLGAALTGEFSGLSEGTHTIFVHAEDTSATGALRSAPPS